MVDPSDPPDIRDHLITHHGYRVQFLHPSISSEDLYAQHHRLHTDDTAVYLDHTHTKTGTVIPREPAPHPQPLIEVLREEPDASD